MYIQITDRCNMRCAHCAFSCTEEGADMSMSLFKKIANKYSGDSITLGGGEPTLHPYFDAIIGISLLSFDSVLIVSNGSNSRKTLQLIQLAEGCEKLTFQVSIDEYHNWPSKEVYSMIRGKPHLIRDTSSHIINVGRAVDNQLGGRDGCVCDDPLVKPNGDVYYCGCSDAPKIGHILDNELPSTYGCHKENCDGERELEARG